MIAEDFVTMWEQRLLEVAMPCFDPAPELDTLEGSAVAIFADGATLIVSVDPEEELTPGAGYWRCTVRVQYGYERTDSADSVSSTWGLILQAFGDGWDGGGTLTERLRVDPGRLVVPKGLDVVYYDRPILTDPEQRVKELAFTAFLGVTRLAPS